MKKVIIAVIVIACLTGCKGTEIPKTSYESRADIQYAIEAESSIKPENVEYSN